MSKQVTKEHLPEPITTKLMFFTRLLRFGPVETNRNQLRKGVDSQLIVPRGRYACERWYYIYCSRNGDKLSRLFLRSFEPFER